MSYKWYSNFSNLLVEFYNLFEGQSVRRSLCLSADECKQMATLCSDLETILPSNLQSNLRQITLSQLSLSE